MRPACGKGMLMRRCQSSCDAHCARRRGSGGATFEEESQRRRRNSVDEHQRQGLHRRSLRAPDTQGARQVACATARRGRQGRARGRRVNQGRCRRLFLRLRGHAGPGWLVDGRLYEPEAAPHRHHRHRRLVLSRACRTRGRGHCRRPMQRGAGYAGGAAAQRRHGDGHRAARRQSQSAGPAVRVSLCAGDGQHVRHVRHAPHAPVRHHQRAAGLGQGRSLPPCSAQRACDAARCRHRRGCRQFADGHRSAASPRLLRYQRRRRRPGARRARRSPRASSGRRSSSSARARL